MTLHRSPSPAAGRRAPRGTFRALGVAAAAAGLLAGGLSLSAPGTAAAAADGPDIIVNGDFSDGTAPWWWTENNPGTVVDGQLCADIPAGTTNAWDAIVGQDDIPLTLGESYELTFTASASIPRTIRTNVQLAVDPFTQEHSSADQLGATPTTFTHVFTAGDDYAAAQLAFQVGGSDEAWTFCLDDISLRSGAEPPTYDPDTGSPVRVNQVGYLTNGPKSGTVVTDATGALPWSLTDATGAQVASGSTVPFGTDPTSLQNVHTFDFSGVTQEGDGYTVTIDGATSEPFSIGSDLYDTLRSDALAYFYHNRSGIEIEAGLVGAEYARPAGHLNVAPNQGDNDVPCVPGVCDYTLDAVGGWYDAGDHGKYVVNGGIAAAQVMSVYERTLAVDGADSDGELGDGRLAVPEQGNGVPDVLDEARWEMDFLMDMQVPAGESLAGMAHHKLHDAAWTGLPLLPHEDSEPRELHAPSTAATLNLAATGAQCARLFEPYDAAFAADCLSAAETAYAAAEANPDVYADPNDGVGGGAYSDDDVTDEFYWAAAELFVTTGDNGYLADVTGSPLHGDTDAVFPRGGFSWGSTAALGALSLATLDSDATSSQVAEFQDMVIEAADGYAADSQSAAYGVPFDAEYVWGSNSQVMNNMVVLATAHDLTGQASYRDAVLRGLDYLLGRNPLNQSYVTGYGERDSENQHHRHWANQFDASLPHPAPGSVAGGPNEALQDPIAEEQLAGCAPAMCYIDHIESYATNEITVNWNAPLAWLASYTDDLGAGDGDDGGGSDESGTDESGTDESGTDESGTDESGTDESGTDESGTDESGTDESGSGDPASCLVDYQSNRWSSGFSTNVILQNTGTEAIDGWELTWSFEDNQTITQYWSANISQSGQDVSATPVAWNGTIQPGSSVNFGFNGESSGSVSDPAAFSVNGEACDVA